MSAPPTPEHLPTPVPGEERLLAVDVLRGFALLGILLVNLGAMASPAYGRPAESLADMVVAQVLAVLFEGKFLTLYSLLFGLGTCVQLEHLESRGARFAPLYLRRLAMLLAIGLVHAVFIWSGDILALYALAGVPLLLFRKVRRGQLLVTAVLLFLVPQAWYHGLELRRAQASAVSSAHTAEVKAVRVQESSAQALRAYRGSYASAVVQRLRELKVVYRNLPTSLTVIFSMGLLGLWVGRKGWLHRPAAHRGELRWTFAVTFSVGLGLSLAWVVWGDHGSLGSPIARFLVDMAGSLGAPMLMMSYVTGLALLLLRERWRRLLAVLAPAGRMSLSNYLLQSLVGTLTFYGYGLGLYGKVGLLAQLLLGLGLYPVQLALSAWWMERFRFGPVEWLWRSLTYGRAQPMRRNLSVPVEA